MATGDFTIFEEFTTDLGTEVHNLSSDVLKFGIIDNTTPPTAADATPTWSDYSANEISTGGGYTGPVTLTDVTYTEASGTATLAGDSFTISSNASGQASTTAWGILYNETAASDQAIGFFELGTIDITAGDVIIKFNNVASGSPGTIFTVAVV
jgi:hypothetical protein